VQVGARHGTLPVSPDFKAAAVSKESRKLFHVLDGEGIVRDIGSDISSTFATIAANAAVVGMAGAPLRNRQARASAGADNARLVRGEFLLTPVTPLIGCCSAALDLPFQNVSKCNSTYIVKSITVVAVPVFTGLRDLWCNIAAIVRQRSPSPSVCLEIPAHL
jgi:hypothetical protein